MNIKQHYMLEQLDKDVEVLSTQQTDTRVNQQETLAYLGGLFDGEGTFGINRINPTKSKGIKYRANIALSNTDAALINALTDLLDEEGLRYHIATRQGRLKHHLTQYTVSIIHLESQSLFLELIIPCLRGVKKDEARLCQRFVKSRLRRNQKEPERHPDGTFVKNGKAPFTRFDRKLHQEMRKLRDPQRLNVLPRAIG